MNTEEFKQKMAERDCLERYKVEFRQKIINELNDMSDPFKVKDNEILLNNTLEHLRRYSELCIDSNKIYNKLIQSLESEKEEK